MNDETRTAMHEELAALAATHRWFDLAGGWSWCSDCGCNKDPDQNVRRGGNVPAEVSCGYEGRKRVYARYGMEMN